MAGEASVFERRANHLIVNDDLYDNDGARAVELHYDIPDVEHINVFHRGAVYKLVKLA